MTLCRLIYGILTSAVLVLASSGDRSPAFQQCLSGCTSRICSTDNTDYLTPTLPLALRLTRWSCTDDCKYRCMHTLTDIAIEEKARALEQGQPPHPAARVQQFYGKWPFWRLAGMQEPASVLFSMMNLATHVVGMRKILRSVPQSFHMRPFYLGWSILAMNAWVWSSVFHTRDTPRTEMLDYFSAGLVILYSLFFTAVRLFHLYPQSSSSPFTRSQNTAYKYWAALCALVYIGHISYLTLLPRFDYTYNMAANLVVGLIHNALWLLYPWGSIRLFPGRDKQYRPGFALQPAWFVLVTTLATTLELFDFPPWCRTIDAHALWHLATVPIVPLWYDFLVKDASDPAWRVAKI
ncbi:Per1-like protein [Ceratobasidium sp. AG-I]|nr:Per1-like protein [Ceratobasidium sp. AG-I]